MVLRTANKMPVQKEYNKSEFLLTAADFEKSYMLKKTWLASLIMVRTCLAISDMIKHSYLASFS